MQRTGPRPTAPPEIAASAGGDGSVARKPGWWRQAWRWLMPGPSAELAPAQLNRQLTLLERARAELEAGWVQGGWWAVSSADGSPILVVGYAAAGDSPDRVEGVCLVGALMHAGSRLPGAASEVGRTVDAVYDALWAPCDQPGAPPSGWLPPVPPPDVRQARVRMLTQWNDRAGRTQAEVLAVVDRAISATIMDLMSVPQPAPAELAGTPAGGSTG